ncbi:MAG: T9SS type A sorting domain-containing protein [Bacteroidia bacterium]
MKTKSILFIFFAIAFKTASSQCSKVTVAAISNFVTFSIDSVLESNGMRNGPDYKGATLYYPVKGSGNYKSIVLVPGYLAAQTSVASWGRFFASHGFVAMAIGTNNTSDQPELRAKALLDAMVTLKLENKRIASPLHNNLDTNNVAVGGWSMGGGGAQLASVLDKRVKAVFAIAPWLDNSKLIAANLNHSSPILIFSAQLDNVAPPAKHANLHYDFTPATTQKVLFEIAKGDHSTGLSPSFGKGDLGNVAFAWMNLFLNDDSCYCKIVKNDSMNQHVTASKFLTNVNCGVIASVSENSSIIGLSVYPNPTNGNFILKQNSTTKIEIKIHNIFGELIYKTELCNQQTTIDLSKEAKGIYFLNATDNYKNVTCKKIIIE